MRYVNIQFQKNQTVNHFINVLENDFDFALFKHTVITHHIQLVGKQAGSMSKRLFLRNNICGIKQRKQKLCYL